VRLSVPAERHSDALNGVLTTVGDGGCAIGSHLQSQSCTMKDSKHRIETGLRFWLQGLV
ncbi:MAG: hypothetical protein RLZZ627_1316, partial [Pseudomonadota bacterium]